MNMRAQTVENLARRTRRAAPKTQVRELDEAVREAGDWTAAVAERLGLTDTALALECLKSTLQALRDQLDLEAAAAFGRHLPLFARALYYDGWTSRRREPAAGRAQFLARIEGSGPRQRGIKRERAAKAALEVVCHRVPASAMAQVATALPPELSQLWPDEPAPYFDLRNTGPLLQDPDEMRRARSSPTRLRRASRYAQGDIVANALPERRGPSKKSARLH